MPRVTVERRERLLELSAPEPRDSFIQKDLYRVQFAAGTSLYKFTDRDAVSAGVLRLGQGGFVTPWWFSYETLVVQGDSGDRIQIPGVRHHIERSSRAGSTFRDYQRSRGAVSMDYKNPMDHLLVVALRRPFVGLIGRCSPKVRLTMHPNVSFIGGAFQVYLPGVARHDVTVKGFGKV